MEKAIKCAYFFTHKNVMVGSVYSVLDIQFISFPLGVSLTADASTNVLDDADLSDIFTSVEFL